ncbi:hypothetical protein ACYATP_01855 [Lactobacillaceae bacterium Melli_B4]
MKVYVLKWIKKNGSKVLFGSLIFGLYGSIQIMVDQVVDYFLVQYQIIDLIRFLLIDESVKFPPALGWLILKTIPVVIYYFQKWFNWVVRMVTGTELILNRFLNIGPLAPYLKILEDVITLYFTFKALH